MQSKKITVHTLQHMAQAGDKIAMLTCYDASFASLMNACGVEILLIGDSLGMVSQGRESTVGVTLDDMVYHTGCVAAGNGTALLLADLPFGSYGNTDTAWASAAALMRAGAHMVKLEGHGWTVPIVRHLTQRGIPVCAHIGLTPQSVHQLGGYKVQGKSEQAAKELQQAAIDLQEAGAAIVLLEAVPAELGRQITDALRVPTIGIGAGPDCSGQVLVSYDALGVYPGKTARFVKNFMHGSASIADALRAYVSDVKAGAFPGPEHCF